MKVTLEDFSLTSVEVKNGKIYYKGLVIVEQGIDDIPVTDGFNSYSTKEPVKELKDKFALFAKYAVDVIEDVDLHYAFSVGYVGDSYISYKQDYKKQLETLYCVTGLKLKTEKKSLAVEISGVKTTSRGEVVPFCTHPIRLSDTIYGWEDDLENDWHEFKGMMFEYIYLNKHANDGGALPMV